MSDATSAAGSHSHRDFDLAVVGGGCNGTAIARDAAGRGLSVVLLERGDLAGETSWTSSKLVHGGLRYLEHLELRLVRESLQERAILLRAAPHLVRPLRFVLPVGEGGRPRWMLRFGLALYDRLGGHGALPGSHALRLPGHPLGEALRPGVERGFTYFDAHADDARLVLAAARDARARGADVRVRTELVSARRAGGTWRLAVRDGHGARAELTARTLVDAAGPWALDVHARAGAARPRHGLRFVQGSHIVVPRLYPGGHAYVLPGPDGRIVFVIPWERDFTLVGTTEVVRDAPDRAAVTEAEVAYLCEAVGRWLREAPGPGDVRWSFAGTRALVDDGRASASAVTRDYAFELDADERGRSPLLTVLGGKLTTFRRLGERALEELRPFHPQAGPAWSATATLPGGDLPGSAAGEEPGAGAGAAPRDGTRQPARDPVADWARTLSVRHPSLPAPWLEALALRHGREAEVLLAGVARAADLGDDLAPGAPLPLFERELEWFVREEWARDADDVLVRRTKHVLHADDGLRPRVEAWLRAHRSLTT